MNILLKTVLFISLLSLFGDCMEEQFGVTSKSTGTGIAESTKLRGKGKGKFGGTYEVENTTQQFDKMDIDTNSEPKQNEKKDIGTNAKPKQKKEKGLIGIKRKPAGIKIEEPSEVKSKGKVVETTSRKGKEKVGEKIRVMEDTTEQLEKMDIAQDNAKMEDINSERKENEEKAPPKYLFIWGNNDEKNIEVDHAVIRLSKELSELFYAEPDNANQREQETLPVPKEEAEKRLKEVKDWYAHHKYDGQKNAPIFVFKCKGNVTLVLNIHLDTAHLSKTLSHVLEDIPDEAHQKPILSPAQNFKSDIMIKLMKMSEEYKYKFDSIKKKTDEPMGLDVAGTIAEEIQKFIPPPHIMQWDVKTDLEMVRAADFYEINRLINDNYIDNVYEIVKVKWINGKTPQEIRKAFGVEEPYPPGHPEWARVEKENEWEESDEEREARHAKEREEEEERERKEEQKSKEKEAEAERLRQEQLQQQQQEQNQEQEHQQGQQHDEGQGHDEDMNDEWEEEDDE
ncbi:hypothetical protein niasHT_002845 [Heterodera trifolii]|uniref:SKP1 component dimerisation domain-containing protein n=1 Tax=Heterodera trifolii TaxID=157864 RepID=A0ABD2LQL7_9BILA